MDFMTFKESLNHFEPPAGLSIYLQAMWLEGKGKWDQAHAAISDLNDQRACLIHAHLHRVEGDISNARYWYARAKRDWPENTTDQEFDAIVKELLLHSDSKNAHLKY